ncbi:MAG: hypothetical protein V4850_32735 [Myxococcota bacterium]
MRTLAPVTLFSLFVALGCGGGGSFTDLVPTPGGYQARLDSFTGRSVNTAIADLGAPTRVVDMAEGHRLYVWEEKSEMRTPMVGEERHDAQRGTDTVVISGFNRVPLDCFTELQTDAAGVVVRNRVEGLACIGTAPAAGTPAALTTTAPLPVAPPPVAPPPVAVSPVALPPAAIVADAAEDAPDDAADAANAEASTANERRRPRRARPLRDRNRE